MPQFLIVHEDRDCVRCVVDANASTVSQDCETSKDRARLHVHTHGGRAYLCQVIGTWESTPIYNEPMQRER